MAKAIENLPKGIKANKDAVAETIENNVRAKIVKEARTDPAYFEKMSALLNEIIAARKAKAIEYEEYLKRIADLARRVQAGKPDDLPHPSSPLDGVRFSITGVKRRRVRSKLIRRCATAVLTAGGGGVSWPEKMLSRLRSMRC